MKRRFRAILIPIIMMLQVFIPVSERVCLAATGSSIGDYDDNFLRNIAIILIASGVVMVLVAVIFIKLKGKNKDRELHDGSVNEETENGE